MNSNVPMRFKLRSNSYIGFPIMFLSLGELLPQVVQRQFLALVRLVEAEVPVVMEPPAVVELLGVVVQGHPLIHEVHCSYLTQLWNSTKSYSGITKGLGLRTYKVCKVSNVSSMRVYEKLMHICVG
jgi:hypothetical protein